MERLFACSWPRKVALRNRREGNVTKETQDKRSIRSILLPVDGSTCADKAVSYAAPLAEKLSAKVHVLFVSETHSSGPWYYYVLDSAASDEIVEKGKVIADRAGEVLTSAGVKEVEMHVEEGHPGEEIPRAATALNVDLIVMGAHGRRGLERALMGSIAREVANTSRVPLLLVR
jgi:nucleotide-binding universal stress UspA family protein